MQGYGATQQEWTALHFGMGLTRDLLPVVSHPDALISPKSAMKDKGKTPSRYNTVQQIVGFPNWTQFNATHRHVKTWMGEKSYGICIQTREVRALDLDLLDRGIVQYMKSLVKSEFGIDLPERFRGNSEKCLLAFRLPGQYAKRVIKTIHGKIEFLANGQQFIACGTHPSRTRYEWRGGLPYNFPEITAEQFERFWELLQAEVGIEPTEMGKIDGMRKDGPTVEMEDGTLYTLQEKGLVLGYGRQNQAFIDCPWKDDHTRDSGYTECAYFPKGTRGYEQGHFKCFHAHCEHHTDAEFEEALGIRQMDFEDVSVTTEIMSADKPPLRRQTSGEPLAVIGNVIKGLRRPDMARCRIFFDRFKDDIMIGEQDSSTPLRPLEDTDYTMLRCTLEEKEQFKPISPEMMRSSVELVAKEHTFDSAIDWLMTLKWDGVKRIDNFMHQYLSADDTPYTRAVGRYLWTALAGRTLRPGIKADMAIILIGEQGIFKSSAVAAIAPNGDSFCNISFAEPEDTLARKMRGKQVGEIGELRGLHTKELEAIKEWIVKTHDEWIPKYKERRVRVPRRLIFIGTTNSREIFADPTGERRWLPVDVTHIKINELVRDRDQLWAEAHERFLAEGILFKEAEKLAKLVHEDYRIVDMWEAYVVEWLTTADEMDGTTPQDREYIRTEDILRSALNMDVRNVKGIHEGKRIGAILKVLGYTRTKHRTKGEPKPKWVWKRVAKPGADLC